MQGLSCGPGGESRSFSEQRWIACGSHALNSGSLLFLFDVHQRSTEQLVRTPAVTSPFHEKNHDTGHPEWGLSAAVLVGSSPLRDGEEND